MIGKPLGDIAELSLGAGRISRLTHWVRSLFIANRHGQDAAAGEPDGEPVRLDGRRHDASVLRIRDFETSRAPARPRRQQLP